MVRAVKDKRNGSKATYEDVVAAWNKLPNDEQLPDAEEMSRIASEWQRLPKGKPLPDTPEMRELMVEFLIEMYGPALKELEKN